MTFLITTAYDIPYGNNFLQKVDVIVPNLILGVVVFVHGGGWSGGSKSSSGFSPDQAAYTNNDEQQLSLIANQGYMVINCNYRLTSNLAYGYGGDETGGYPNAIEDIKTILRFCTTQGAGQSFNNNWNLIFDIVKKTGFIVTGSGEGAHLAMVAACEYGVSTGTWPLAIGSNGGPMDLVAMLDSGDTTLQNLINTYSKNSRTNTIASSPLYQYKNQNTTGPWYSAINSSTCNFYFIQNNNDTLVKNNFVLPFVTELQNNLPNSQTRVNLSQVTEGNINNPYDHNFATPLNQQILSFANLTTFNSLYNVTVDKKTATEGDTVTFTVTYVNFPLRSDPTENKIVLAPDYSTSTINDEDVENPPLVYEHQATSTYGTFSFTWTIKRDNKVEGTEVLKMALWRKTAFLGERLLTTAINSSASDSVTILDIDKSPTPWSITSNLGAAPLTVNEGTTITFTITAASNIPLNATCYLSTGSPNTTDSNDLSAPKSPNEVVLTNGVGTGTITVTADQLTEGGEYFTVFVEYPSGTRVLTFGQINITDTSLSQPLTPTYFISSSQQTINEGQAVTFSIATTNITDGTVLYWTNGGTTNANDFSDDTNSGTITINNSTATVVRTLKNDLITEGNETIIFQLRTGSTSGAILASASTVTVNDTSIAPLPTYSISPNVTSINEGQTVTYTITTTNVTNGAVLYWTNGGTTNANDFSDGINSDQITINNNTATVVRTLKNDLITEGNETIIFQLRTGSTSGAILASASTVTVNDTSIAPLPTYIISPNVTSLNEGQTVTYTITTTNVTNGTILNWANIGNTNANDFSDGINLGTITINNNTATIIRTLKNDLVTEGTETVILELRTSAGQLLATSSTVTVTDTSTTPSLTYSISPNVTSINEGQTVTYTITTTNVTNGAVLYWTNGGTTNANDFSDSINSDQVIVYNNTATIVRTLKNDITTEGNETIILQLRTGGIGGSVVATASTVTVNDTSISVSEPTPWSITSNLGAAPLTVNEGTTITFTITAASNIPLNATCYLSTGSPNTTDSNDLSAPKSPNEVVLTNGVGTGTITVTADQLTEGGEYFTVFVEYPSGTRVLTFGQINITDTSVTPTSPIPPTYSVSSSQQTINEGQAVTFSIATTNITDGTVLYWTNGGTTNANDFSDDTNSGQVIVNNNTATVVRTLKNDLTTEGNETIILQLRTGGIGGSVVATASTVTVNDTSITPPSTYKITTTRTGFNEGESIVFTITSSPSKPNTRLFWRTTAGSATSNDFNDNANTGEFVTDADGVGTVTRTILNDYIKEGQETIIFEISDNGIFGAAIASITVSIFDTSTPTASISVSATTISEGDSVVFTITTRGLPNGSVLFWTNTGTNLALDFTDNINLGSVTIINNNATITRTLNNDLNTDGEKTIVIELKTADNESLGSSPSVLVSDTSVTPSPTYNITTGQSTVDEGQSITYTITTTNISNNSSLYWTTTGTTSAADFSDGKTSGAITINDNTATIVRTLKNDLTTEGNETIVLQLRIGSVSGPVVAASASIVVNDTSITQPPTYNLTASTLVVNEGSGVSFFVTSTNVGDGTILQWETSGTANAYDFDDNVTSGTVVVKENYAVINRFLSKDALIEGDETFTLDLITPSSRIQIGPITIKDSNAPITLNQDRIAMNEGESVTFTFKTGPGVTINWYNIGSTSADDFIDGLNSGQLIANENGIALLTLTLVNDLSYFEGNESIKIMAWVNDKTVISNNTSSKTILVLDSSQVVLPPWFSTSTFKITPSATVVNEGSTLTYNITTTNYPNGTILCWENIGTATASDFENNQNSGTVTINNNSASLSIPIRNDNITETVESFIPKFNLTSPNGPVIYSPSSPYTGLIQINDTSKNTSSNPTYSISTRYDTLSSNEGVSAIKFVSKVTFYVTTTNIPNNTILYYKNVGTTTAADFNGTPNEGPVTIIGNSGSILFTLLEDKKTEGDETIVVELRTGSVNGPTVAKSSIFKIIDNSTGTVTGAGTVQPAPKYDIRGAINNVYREGNALTFAVDTFQVTPGTILYWKTTSDSTFSDFGTATVMDYGFDSNHDGSASFFVILKNDNIYNTNNKLIVEVRTDSPTGTVVATFSQNIIEGSLQPIPTYEITASSTLIREGQSVYFGINTTNVSDGTILYWKNIGNTNAADFNDGLNSGSVTISNGSATILKSLINDLVTEGNETIVIELRLTSITGTLVATSPTVTVIDSSQAVKTYSIVPNKQSINEGDSVTYTITTSGLLSGTILYWNNIGSTSAIDFTNGQNKGSILINNNSATVNLTTLKDQLTEGDENIILELRIDSFSGTVVALSSSVTVVDISRTPPSYSITVDKTLIDESDTLNFVINTANLDQGTVLYWSLIPFKGTTIVNSQDTNVNAININDVYYSKTNLSIKSNILSGVTFFDQFNKTGRSNASITMVSDNLTEGYEGFRIALYDSSSATTPLALSEVVVINDTSQTPPPTYSIVPDRSTVDEGETITYTITTTNVADGTVLYLQGQGSTATIPDFDTTDFSIVIQNNSAQFLLKVKADLLTEGVESIILNLCAKDQSILATASRVTINDTSKSPPTYKISANKSSVNEGGSVTYTITTTNVDDGTVLYITNSGSTSDSDFTDTLPRRSIILNGGSASFDLSLIEDSLTEGDQTIVLELRTNGYSGPIVSSVTTLVKDTSISPASYFINPETIKIDENKSIKFIITTAGVPNNSIIYWKNLGTTTASDFTDNVNSGTVTIVNNYASITRTLVNDFKTEGSETIIISLVKDSIDGRILTTSRIVTVNDTSLDPTFALSSNVSIINEGESVSFIVNTNLPDDSKLYWVDLGTTDQSDYEITVPTSGTDDGKSGSIVIKNNYAMFVKTLKNDLKTEGDEYIIMDLRKDSINGPSVLDTPVVVSILDTSFNTAIYNVSIGGTSPITEGSSITIYFSTVNIPDLTFNWEISGTMTANDFVDNLSSGTVTTKNGVGKITKTIKNDLITDGDKKMFVQMKSVSGTVLAKSNTILVTDTSQSPTSETYSIVPTETEVYEGNTANFNIITTGVVDNTTLYWELVQAGGFTAADVVGSTSSGSFKISGGSAKISIPIADDSIIDPGESLIVRIKKNTSQSPVAISEPVLILERFRFSVNGKLNTDQSLNFGTYLPDGIEASVDVTILGLSGTGLVTATIDSLQPNACVAYWGNPLSNKEQTKSVTVKAKSSVKLTATIIPVLLGGGSSQNSGVFRITNGTQTYNLSWVVNAI